MLQTDDYQQAQYLDRFNQENANLVSSYFNKNNEGTIKENRSKFKTVIFNLTLTDCLKNYLSVYTKVILITLSIILAGFVLLELLTGFFSIFMLLRGAFFISTSVLTIFSFCFFIDLVILFLLRKTVVTQHHIMFYEKCFIEETSKTDSNKHEWESIFRVTETKEFIKIYMSLTRLHLIPKRIFKDEFECQEFVQFIKSKKS
ncbi:MAG: YcxB family protein [Acidobacteria bacterium]|nr:YcxB family protein [Acidobacteriota bacterium]